MRIGYAQGVGILHRAHPFTALSLAGTAAVLAFVLPGTASVWLLVVGLAVLGLAAGLSQTLVVAALFAAPFWFFLALIHGVFGSDWATALAVSGRITAILTSFLLVLAVVQPARLIDAMLARGVPFSVAYLLGATLQAVPRLSERAAAILDAQRCRGLQLRGSPWRRLRTLVPLAVPLVLGALAEVDERAVALEIRGAVSGRRRTPLHPPPDSGWDRIVRWTLATALVGAVGWRLMR